MADLPDFRAWVEAVYLLAASLAHGAFTARPADPDDGDCYLATDTERFYVCYADGLWTDVTAAYLLLAGGTMSGAIAMGTNKITGLGDPTAAQDAATRAYTLAQIAVHALLTATHGVAGIIAGLADIVSAVATHAALTATHGIAGTIAGLADIVSYITTHTANASAHHTKYTDAEAKAASVSAGAITDGETKAPTHDAVFDVKVIADDAQTAAEVDADIATHAALLTGIHGLALGARVYNSANISIPNATWTELTFDTERYDTDTIHSTVSNTGRLTCKTAGIYLIACCVEFAANATGLRQLVINVGADSIFGQYIGATASGTLVYGVSTLWPMEVNEYATVEVYQSSGAALNIVAHLKFSPEFMIARIG